MGESLNVMTLGGFALAVGILVDDATVVIENIERHLEHGTPVGGRPSSGPRTKSASPTMIATLAICVVFVPIFLLQGTSKYLFAPLAVAVVVSLLASRLISFTVVPVLFKQLMKNYVHRHDIHADGPHAGPGGEAHAAHPNPYVPSHHGFNRYFLAFRDKYRNYLAWAVHHPVVCWLLFVGAAGLSCLLFPRIGMDFFPRWTRGRCGCTCARPPARAWKKTQALFGRVERAIREIVGRDEVDVMLDNIGLPYSGINIALSDTATAGPMDGEILISLKKEHRPTAEHMAALRRELPERFPEDAVLLPAGGHRQPGPQLRPAFAD